MKRTTTAITGLLLVSLLSGCAPGNQALGGHCDQILSDMEKVRNNVEPEYNATYPDLLNSVYVYDNYAINDVIGDLHDYYVGNEDQFGSTSNNETVQTWLSSIAQINQYAYASGMKVDFFSPDMGPTYLKSAYSNFESSSTEIEAICAKG